jgi:hypothetical protein
MSQQTVAAQEMIARFAGGKDEGLCRWLYGVPNGYWNGESQDACAAATRRARLGQHGRFRRRTRE